ncbi:hypothetical protein J1N35_028889 [Gossypium stocksii]|uniref:Endonuclease/exonuclease/phosphatase domain-containing protein n=1 Tax=Gossypium stocksii TaxID=47602 RepID=A0A9D3UWU9_9ROSI|nr:hypothetical protein J1N35_028889 [Gossypium stocksii]
MLRKLNQEPISPWIVGGDFNEIMFTFEKCGGVQRDPRRIEAFQEVLEECQLFDLGYTGVSYTWERGNLLETNIRERLDRGLANEGWMNLFPMGGIHHLPYSTYDHYPLLLTIESISGHLKSPRFHFEAWWTLEEDLESVIKES